MDKMWETYELTPTPAEAIRIELPDPAAARSQADTLRTQMRTLGNVNLDAPQAYAALTERFEFLRTQKDDLETAQHELQKVIDELTVRMKEIFASEFAKLNHYFGETFTEIFGGGHAELQLADTSDILNCGHRHQGQSAGQGGQDHHPAVGRRKGICRHRALFCHPQGTADPVLCARRDRSRTGRCERHKIRTVSAPFVGCNPVHRHHAPTRYDGGGRHALRRDHAGAGRIAYADAQSGRG